MEINAKFRGNCKIIDKQICPEDGWVSGFFYQDLVNGEIKSYIVNCPCIWEVLEETVSQFTGLLDKNDKEIYNGDIIASGLNNEIKHIISYQDIDAQYVAWFSKNDYCSITQKWIKEFNKVIIGNVYDNKDLFKLI